MTTKLDYTVRVMPLAHELDITLRVERAAAGDLKVATVTWVPGAYGFMKYGRDLFDVQAGGATIRREGWSGFVIKDAPAIVEITYRCGAYDPAWGELAGLVDHEYAVLLATRYLHVVGEAGPLTVSYDLPDGWAIHHPAGAKELAKQHYEYPSFATLLDTPVVCGRFERHSREVMGTRFDAIFVDRCVGFDREHDRLMDCIAAIAIECHTIFGSFPFERYSFIFTFNPAAHWGLEHANSTMIALDPMVFIEDKPWHDALRVMAHELFHAWNVCRLKPAPLDRPDYLQGTYPDALWVAEGFTRWYEFLLTCRAGLVDPRRALSNVINYLRHLATLPAYRRVSAEDSSLGTFLNHNRYAGSVNATVDYYDLGMLIAFDFDAGLRLSDTARSLDTEIRAIYDAFSIRPTGFTSDEALDFFLARSPDLKVNLAREVKERGALATTLLLEALGFELETREVPCLGVILEDTKIQNILDTSPAGASGLATGDELVRVNGFPFHRHAFEWLLSCEPSLSIEVRRGHRSLTFNIPVGRRQDIVGLRWHGDDAQLERLRTWFHRDDFTLVPGEALGLGAYDNFHGIQTVL